MTNDRLARKHQTLRLRQRKALTRFRQSTCPKVPTKHRNVVRTLVRHQQPSPSRIEREMTRHRPTAGGPIQKRQPAVLTRYCKRGNNIVEPVRSIRKPRLPVDHYVRPTRSALKVRRPHHYLLHRLERTTPCGPTAERSLTRPSRRRNKQTGRSDETAALVARPPDSTATPTVHSESAFPSPHPADRCGSHRDPGH